MKSKGPSSKQFKLSLFATLIILATVPFALYSILSDQSFDPTSDASEETLPVTCEISLPYVNPTSIPLNSSVQLHFSAQENGGDTVAEYEEIVSINISSQSGGVLFDAEYTYNGEENLNQYSESFLYKSPTEGIDVIVGAVVARQLSGDLKTYECTVNSPLVGNKLSVLAVNLAPTFTTSYAEAQPSNVLKKGDSYTYTLKATDPEGDNISYHYSFSPGTDWLKMSVVKDGVGGNLELKFQGIAGDPAGYLANVFIHDGYDAHLSNQAWVISVEQGANDSPVVKVTAPTEPISVVQGEKVTINWTATDLNQIVEYNLYYTTTPGDKASWKKIDGLDNKFGGYVFDTSLLIPDHYFIVVEAKDNYNPPATGIAVSPKISVSAKPVEVPVEPTEPEQPEEPIDGPVLKLPEVKNVSPANGSKLKNTRPTISATLVAGKGYQVRQSTIKLSLDGKDVTEAADISKITASEYRIIYRPKDELKSGSHKVNVTFSDNNDKVAKSDWSFIIEGTSDDVFTIFGFEIPKQTAIIFGIGLLILLAALAVPWILYAAWKNSNDEDEKYSVYNLPPSDYDRKVEETTTSTVAYKPNATYTTNNSYTTTPETYVETAPAETYVNTSVGLAPDFSQPPYVNNTADYSANYTPYENVTDYDKNPAENSELTYAQTGFQNSEPEVVETKTVTTEVTPIIVNTPPAQEINQATTVKPTFVEPAAGEEIYVEQKAVQPVFVEPTAPVTNTTTEVIYSAPDISTDEVTNEDKVDETLPNEDELQKLANALQEYKEESKAKDPYSFLDEVNIEETQVTDDNNRVTTTTTITTETVNPPANSPQNPPRPVKQPGADAV